MFWRWWGFRARRHDLVPPGSQTRSDRPQFPIVVGRVALLILGRVLLDDFQGRSPSPSARQRRSRRARQRSLPRLLRIRRRLLRGRLLLLRLRVGRPEGRLRAFDRGLGGLLPGGSLALLLEAGARRARGRRRLAAVGRLAAGGGLRFVRVFAASVGRASAGDFCGLCWREFRWREWWGRSVGLDRQGFPDPYRWWPAVLAHAVSR